MLRKLFGYTPAAAITPYSDKTSPEILQITKERIEMALELSENLIEELSDNPEEMTDERLASISQKMRLFAEDSLVIADTQVEFWGRFLSLTLISSIFSNYGNLTEISWECIETMRNMVDPGKQLMTNIEQIKTLAQATFPEAITA